MVIVRQVDMNRSIVQNYRANIRKLNRFLKSGGNFHEVGTEERATSANHISKYGEQYPNGGKRRVEFGSYHRRGCGTTHIGLAANGQEEVGGPYELGHDEQKACVYRNPYEANKD